MPDASVPHRLPRRCQACGYDLRGLPDAGNCPECGEGYEPGTYVWVRERSRWSVLADRTVSCIGVAGVTATFLYVLKQIAAMNGGTSKIILLLIAMSAMASVLAIIAIRAWRSFAALPPEFVALEPAGVRYRLPINIDTVQPVSGFLPWEKIVKIAPARFDRACRLELTPDAIAPPEPRTKGQFGLSALTITFFTTSEDAAAFAELAQRRKLAASQARVSS